MAAVDPAERLPDDARRIALAVARAAIPAGARFAAADERTVDRTERMLSGFGRGTVARWGGLLRFFEQAARLSARGRTFSSLSADDAEALLTRWATEDSDVARRTAALALTAPIKIAYYDDPAVYAALGGTFRFDTAAAETPRWMQQVTAAEELHEDRGDRVRRGGRRHRCGRRGRRVRAGAQGARGADARGGPLPRPQGLRRARHRQHPPLLPRQGHARDDWQHVHPASDGAPGRRLDGHQHGDVLADARMGARPLGEGGRPDRARAPSHGAVLRARRAGAAGDARRGEVHGRPGARRGPRVRRARVLAHGAHAQRAWLRWLGRV